MLVQRNCDDDFGVLLHGNGHGNGNREILQYSLRFFISSKGFI